jgi:hypothetical protein
VEKGHAIAMDGLQQQLQKSLAANTLLEEQLKDQKRQNLKKDNFIYSERIGPLASERIGPLAAIITTVFYLLTLYLFALPNTHENPFASIYSEAVIKTTCQHLLLLVGFDTLIYQKYYDTPPILVGHQNSSRSIVTRRSKRCMVKT